MIALCTLGIIAGIIVFLGGSALALADMGENWETGNTGYDGKLGCVLALAGIVLVIASIVGLVV